MTRFKYIYWCISHQQHVAPKALEKLRDKLHRKIVRLNLTHFGQVDCDKLSTWISYEISSSKTVNRRL